MPRLSDIPRSQTAVPWLAVEGRLACDACGCVLPCANWTSSTLGQLIRHVASLTRLCNVQAYGPDMLHVRIGFKSAGVRGPLQWRLQRTGAVVAAVHVV